MLDSFLFTVLFYDIFQVSFIMKRKIFVKFLNQKSKELEIKVRDLNYIDALNKNKSIVFRNKKKYNRKQKHKANY